MVETTAFICSGVLVFCLVLNLIRIILGPSMADRVLAADTIFLNLVGIAALFSVYLNTHSYMDLVLVFSLLGFIGTVCFAKFLSRGKIIE